MVAEGHVTTVTGSRADESLDAVASTVPRAVSGDTLREHLALDGALLEPVELTAGEEPTP